VWLALVVVPHSTAVVVVLVDIDTLLA